MSDTNKKLLISFFEPPLLRRIIFLTILIGIVFFSKLSFNFSDNNTPGLATLVINFETEKRFFEGEVVKDMTMLDTLSMVVSVGKIKLNYAIDKSGNVNIVEIDSHANGVSNKYFVFYLNAKKIFPKDLNKIKVKKGDRIEIRFE